MTDALTKAADAAIAAGGDAVHLANLAARRTRSPLAPANAPPPTSLSRNPSADITDVSERRDSLFRQTDSGKSVYNSLEEFST